MQTLDILGLHLLLKSLEPAKDSLNDQRGRQHWQRQVHKYRPVVERILGQFVQEVDPSGVEEFGRRCIEGIKEARLVWSIRFMEMIDNESFITIIFKNVYLTVLSTILCHFDYAIFVVIDHLVNLRC